MKVFLVLISFLFSTVSLADLIPGGAGSPANMPSGLTIAGGDNISGYESGSITLDGFFTGGVAYYTRVGNLVTISGDGAWTHTSASNGSSTIALPASVRPPATAYNIYFMDGSRFHEIAVNTNGTIYVEYRDHTGALDATTTTIVFPTLTYIVP